MILGGRAQTGYSWKDTLYSSVRRRGRQYVRTYTHTCTQLSSLFVAATTLKRDWSDQLDERSRYVYDVILAIDRSIVCLGPVTSKDHVRQSRN